MSESDKLNESDDSMEFPDLVDEIEVFPELVDEIEVLPGQNEGRKRKYEPTQILWDELLRSPSGIDSSNKIARIETRVPPSFPRPPASVFVRYYAPLEPRILLPNNYLAKEQPLDALSETLEEYLKSRGDIEYSSSGSSWSGRIGVGCRFRICIYRSRKNVSRYIVEAQCLEGSGFVFGSFYQGLKRLTS